MITSSQAILRYHLERLWPRRDEPLVRWSVRDNLRGQRAARQHGNDHPGMHVWVDPVDLRR